MGTVSFYSREEVKDALAYLAVLANPLDEIAFRRAVNKPPRGIGAKSVDRILARASETGGDLVEAARRAGGDLRGKASAGIAALLELLEKYDAVLTGGSGGTPDHLGELMRRLVEDTGLREHYLAIDRVEDSNRTANLEELATAAAAYPADTTGLAEFLELVELDRSLLEEEEADPDRVTLITMHNTKGLEFDRVIVTGLEEGLFPGGDVDMDPEELEEERRLFYVAITRAREDLHLTCCRSRMIYGRFRQNPPSRFLDEVPADRVENVGTPPSAPGRGAAGGRWRPGTRLYHDDYGTGVVQQVLQNSGHTVIHVAFESGRTATVLPEFAAHKIEVLGSGEWD